MFQCLISGFSEYVESSAEALYQKLCSEITEEFNECSKQLREMDSQFLNPEADLAQLLSNIQTQEKQKLHLTVTMQVLKKAGRPSERMLTHETCKFMKPMQHEFVHLDGLLKLQERRKRRGMQSTIMP